MNKHPIEFGRLNMEHIYEADNSIHQQEIRQISKLSANQDPYQLNLAFKLKHGSQGLLTKKESLIASYLLSGCTVNEIAELLSRSKNTVKMHIKNMKKKCHSETQTKFGAVLQSFIKS